MNWRGPPLTSHEVVVDLISATTSRSGLTVRAERDEGSYPTGTKVTDAELAAVPRQAHVFHGEWNYTCNGTRLKSRPRKRTTAVVLRRALSVRRHRSNWSRSSEICVGSVWPPKVTTRRCGLACSIFR